jgi:hypothetical protein
LVGEIKAGRAARLSFVKDLKGEVAAMREGFRRQNKERARTVMALRQEVAADLAGARRAWFGPSPAERRAKKEAKRDRLAALAVAREEAVRHHAAQKAKEVKGTEPGPKGPAKKK